MIRIVSFGTVIWFIACGGIVHAGTPLPLEKVCTADDLVAEVSAKLAELQPWLESADAYKENGDKLRNSLSLMAILGQALAEHPQDSKMKSAGPAIRDAAMSLARAKSLDEAQAAWKSLESAAKGQPAGEHAVEYDWAKLARMHPAMEEMNARAAQLRRVLRRPKDPAADSRHALSIALLAVATYADTHEVKNPADTPKWREYAAALQEHMSASGRALQAKDTMQANKEFLAGMETCTQCHDAFKKR